jgi:hypothetical protein
MSSGGKEQANFRVKLQNAGISHSKYRYIMSSGRKEQANFRVKLQNEGIFK